MKFLKKADLRRHQSSKHNAGKNEYQCAAANCRKKDKVWNRLDNFRKHIKKFHIGENVDALIEK